MEEKILPNKKIMMLTVILAFFLAVSAVSANDANDTAMTGSDASQMKLSSGNGMIDRIAVTVTLYFSRKR